MTTSNLSLVLPKSRVAVSTRRRSGWVRLLALGASAGIVGGAAEVTWMTTLSLTGVIAGPALLEAIAATVVPGGLGEWVSPLTGLGIHFALSVMLGAGLTAAFAFAGRRLRIAHQVATLSVFSLGVVWLVNFSLVLPSLNPHFIALATYPASFVSKMLFGLGMGLTLRLLIWHS